MKTANIIRPLLLLLSAYLFSMHANAQTKQVQYNEYGKPVASTEGEFIVNKAVNLRAEAGSHNDNIIAVLPKGATVTVDGAVHGYYRISFQGKTGYSWHKFFTPK